jgi:predicted tellurium resistance membrane protein TerC
MNFAVVISLVTLSAMEIVLGIDNVIFLAILVGRLPPEKRETARRLGLTLALGVRILLLFSLQWMMRLDSPLFHLTSLGIPQAVVSSEQADGISIRDLIVFSGGLFLIAKSTHEIHDKLESPHPSGEGAGTAKVHATMSSVLLQIAVIDIVFSLDSVISALGMANEFWVMVVAMIVAMVVMLLFSGAISRFVEQHPTVKMLALSFLILIGVMLIAEGLDTHINKGYIYAAMTFSLVVEVLNLRVRKKAEALAAPPTSQK